MSLLSLAIPNSQVAFSSTNGSGAYAVAEILLNESANAAKTFAQYCESSQKTNASLAERVAQLEQCLVASEGAKKNAEALHQAKDKTDKELIGRMQQSNAITTQQNEELRKKIATIAQQNASLSSQVNELSQQVLGENVWFFCG